MKKLVLTTAAALLAGTALAAAQGMNAQQAPGGNKTERAAPAPQAQQQAPADKMAPAKQAQTPSKARETTGQAPKGADVKGDTKGSADIKANDTKTNATENDKAGAPKSDNKASMDNKAKSSMDNNKANDKNKSAMDNKANDKNGKSSAQNDKTRDKSNTTGQGAAGAKGAANLSPEQRTKIRTVIKEKVHIQPVTHVNFSISIGTRVPRTVHFYPVPAEVIAIYPEWRGYQIILVDNQYIIVDPATYEIVYIIA
jgi:hypothetical protein